MYTHLIFSFVGKGLIALSLKSGGPEFDIICMNLVNLHYVSEPWFLYKEMSQDKSSSQHNA